MASNWNLIASQGDWNRLMDRPDAPAHYRDFLKNSRFEPSSTLHLVKGVPLEQVLPLAKKDGARRRIFEEAFGDGFTVREINSRARVVASEVGDSRPSTDADIFIALKQGFVTLRAGSDSRHTWIFQGNPDQFDIDAYLAATRSILWTVRQQNHAPLMRPGDDVFIWRAQGRDKNAIAGIVAHGFITEVPSEQTEDTAALRFWREPADGLALRVRIDIDRVATNKKEIVQRDWLKGDPVLGDLLVLKMTGTNFLIDDPAQAARLHARWKNTGRDWDRSDSVAGLWAHHHTYGRGVSRMSGSPVAEVAVRIGRAVSGVYNKVMNFRAIDPRDDRAGLSGGGESDRRVREEFYDPAARQVRADGLDAEYARLWPEMVQSNEAISDALAAAAAQLEKTEPSTPTDVADGRQRNLAAIVRRQGQGKFRQVVLRAYGGRCAVSGCDVEHALEAAHIYPYRGDQTNAVTNGILLRSDLHTLFDLGLLTVDPLTMTVMISDASHASAYGAFHGKPVSLPARETDLPSSEALSWHRREIGDAVLRPAQIRPRPCP